MGQPNVEVVNPTSRPVQVAIVSGGGGGGGGGDASAANQATQITAEQAILAKLIAAPATSAKQDTGNTSLASIDTKVPALGQAAMAASLPVALASNQSAIPVTVSAGTALVGKVGIDQTTAGSTNATQPKQYTGVPSNFTVATADGTVFTLAAGEIGFVQNLDSADALAVKYGASASTSSFNFILPCGAAQDDGRGGSVRIDDWVGVVSVATLTGTGRYIAWKFAP